MAVPMVCIWNMGVAVRDRLMLVPIAVGALWHGVVQMGVMPIVMPLGMFMFQCVVGMLVRMRFHEMQHNTQHHQYTRNDQQSTA